MQATTRSRVALSTHSGPSTGHEYTTNTVQISVVNLVSFLLMFRDRNQLHTTGRRVIPATMLFAIAAGLVQEKQILGGIPMFRKVRWSNQKPVYAADSVYLKFKIIEIRQVEGTAMSRVKLSLKMFNQRHEPVGQGRWEMGIAHDPAN